MDNSTKQTSIGIIEIMEERVRNNEPISPASYIDAATRVILLNGDMDNKLANFEAMMNTLEAEFIRQDMPQSKAKTLARAEVDYKDYLETKALLKRIENWVMLAKKRATIQDI
jgi:predicted oxidoreductase (fatty acid repression mutant protein)